MPSVTEARLLLHLSFSQVKPLVVEIQTKSLREYTRSSSLPQTGQKSNKIGEQSVASGQI